MNEQVDRIFSACGPGRDAGGAGRLHVKKKDEEVRRVLAETVPIVVAAHDIAVGARIDAGALRLERWPRNSLPPAAIVDLSSVIGSVARGEFVENEPIVTARLVPGGKTSGILPLMIPNNMRAMSVAVG